MNQSNAESGIQLLVRLSGRPSLKTLCKEIFPNGLEPMEVVEVSGKAGSGKSEYLMYLIAQCILPEKWGSVILSGLGCSVAFIDCDYHFDLLRLVTIMESKVSEAMITQCTTCEPSTAAEKTSFIKLCLQKLHIFKCSSSFQFLMTLYSLENILASCLNISILMIDSISAFYWWDRMLVNDNLSMLNSHHQKIIDKLCHFTSEYRLVIIATKQHLMNSKSEDSASETEYEFMGREWQKFVTTRLMMQILPPETKGITNVLLSYHKKNLRWQHKLQIGNSGIKLII